MDDRKQLPEHSGAGKENAYHSGQPSNIAPTGGRQADRGARRGEAGSEGGKFDGGGETENPQDELRRRESSEDAGDATED